MCKPVIDAFKKTLEEKKDDSPVLMQNMRMKKISHTGILVTHGITNQDVGHPDEPDNKDHRKDWFEDANNGIRRSL